MAVLTEEGVEGVGEEGGLVRSRRLEGQTEAKEDSTEVLQLLRSGRGEDRRRHR